jgi:hypothetical protein
MGDGWAVHQVSRVPVVNPGDDRSELLELQRGGRVEVHLAPGDELHAHRWCVEPVAGWAEVVQQRRRASAHAGEDLRLLRCLYPISCGGAVGDSNDDRVGAVASGERHLVDRVAVTAIESVDGSDEVLTAAERIGGVTPHGGEQNAFRARRHGAILPAGPS